MGAWWLSVVAERVSTERAGLALLLAACGSAPSTSPAAQRPREETAATEAPRPSRIPDDEVPDDEVAWLEGDVADAPEVLARYPADPRAHYRMGRHELARGDLEAAEAELRAALAGVDADDELAWRARARLAIVLSQAGRRDAAVEMAGLMCQDPDRAMIPAFMPPLLADLEAAGVCADLCERAVRCCHAYVRAVASAGAQLRADQVCVSVEQVSGPAAETACRSVLDGWRQALQAMQREVPPECRE